MKKLLENKPIKILIIAALTLLILFVVFLILHKVYFEGDMTENEISFLILSIKNVFQTLFFCLIGIITILSYLQARKTLFTPIKTETFKMQIAAFEEILAFFQTKTETGFTEQFDFDFIFKANGRLMFTRYIKTFFKDEIKVNEEALKELKSNFVGGVTTAAFAEKHFEKPEYYEKIEKKDEDEVTNPAILLDQWKKYDHGIINFSKKFQDETGKLQKLISSPLIPVELKDKLESFDISIRNNLYTVGESLTEVSQELPDKFKTAKSIEQFELLGLWNLYNSKSEKLEPKAKDILLYIRQYLRIDELVK